MHRVVTPVDLYVSPGEPGSHVFGSVSEGVFEGKIVAPWGSYYVEKAHRYFPNTANKTFHSVIYSESDVGDPYESLRTGHVGGCGVTDEVSQWMDRVQNGAVDDDDPPPSPGKVKPPQPPFPSYHPNKYSREANEEEEKSRVKRGTRSKDDNRNTCSLFIQTDPLIWRHITEQVINRTLTRALLGSFSLIPLILIILILIILIIIIIIIIIIIM
uniref:Uncharacterized protein n=1 Tax=Timema douglasi TaxID=61478 RepID=A0A7R8VQ97_TIMDO|nr:unnamed protein product [Timema douglasi]